MGLVRKPFLKSLLSVSRFFALRIKLLLQTREVLNDSFLVLYPGFQVCILLFVDLLLLLRLLKAFSQQLYFFVVFVLFTCKLLIEHGLLSFETN